jgi:hypothetical protein
MWNEKETQAVVAKFHRMNTLCGVMSSHQSEFLKENNNDLSQNAHL